MTLSEEKIRKFLPPKFEKYKFFTYQNITSTNTVAKELLCNGLNDEAIVVAESQSAGRGRGGHIWNSPNSGGIYLSLIIKPAIKESEFSIFNITAAVAVCEAVSRNTNFKTLLKWPNDIFLDDKKIGGILIEKVQGYPFLIIGIGLNVNTKREEFSEEVRNIATSLSIVSNVIYDRNRIIAEMMVSMDQWTTTTAKDRNHLLNRWKELTNTIGRKIQVKSGDETVSGTAVDIDNNGFLLVEESNGKKRRVISGELCY